MGSNLEAAHAFTNHYRSTDVHTIRGLSFDRLVIAGLPAAKWLANRRPADDWDTCERLLHALGGVTSARVALVSTVDVYPDPAGWDETHRPSGAGAPYGAHRLAVEDHIRDQFPHAQILRLPALVGPGLKKNAIFDLITGNDVHKINPGGAFQWYDVRSLWADLLVAEAAELGTVNLVTAPVAMADIVTTSFPEAKLEAQPGLAPAYALMTCHATAFGGRPGDSFLPASGLGLVTAFVDEVRRGEVSCALPSR